MKLYTTEQAIEMINEAKKSCEQNVELMICFNIIELPTDEEIEQYLKSFPYIKHLDDGQYNDGVIVGAELAIEWMKDKIQGGYQ